MGDKVNAKALIGFMDKAENVYRKAGDEFDVSKERFDAINAAGRKQLGCPYVEEVRSIEEAAEEQTGKPQRRKAK